MQLLALAGERGRCTAGVWQLGGGGSVAEQSAGGCCRCEILVSVANSSRLLARFRGAAAVSVCIQDCWCISRSGGGAGVQRSGAEAAGSLVSRWTAAVLLRADAL